MGGTYPRSQVDLGGGRGWLTAEAAASIRRIDRAIGHLLQITEAGRSFFQQEKHWLKYLRDGYPIALNPKTPSVHQIGDAIDSDEAQQLVALMAEHGWIRTVYRWVGGVWTLVERWHFEYFIAKDKHRFDPAPSGGGSAIPVSKEDDMFPAVLEIAGDSSAGKSLYDLRSGRAIRAISRDENSSLRRAESKGMAVYISVSKAEYKQRGGK